MMASAPRQTGIALLAALVLVMTITFIMSNIFYRHQINVAQTTLSMHQNQATLLALSAESWARQLLDDDTDNSTYDHFEEMWAQAIPALPVDGGLVNGCISDLQGRFNLNNFASLDSKKLKMALKNNDNASIAKVWNYLLNLQEIPIFPGRVATIIDWVDKGSVPVNSDGAEQDDYASFMPPRMVGDDLMAEPSELAAVVGYEVFEVQKLMPWITALPIPSGSKTTPININTASDELLLALGGHQDMQFRDSVEANKPFDDIATFHAQLEIDFAIPLADVEKRWPNTLVDVKSDYFQLYIEVLLGEARIEVKSIIDRSGRDSVIISRDLTTVPVSLSKDSDSALFEKLAASAGLGSGGDMEEMAEEMLEDQQVQPACLMIGA